MSDIYSLDRCEPPMAVLVGRETRVVPLDELPGTPREGDVYELTSTGWRERPELADARRAMLADLRRQMLEAQS